MIKVRVCTLTAALTVIFMKGTDPRKDPTNKPSSNYTVQQMYVDSLTKSVGRSCKQPLSRVLSFSKQVEVLPMSQSMTSLRSPAVRDVWEAGSAACCSRLLDCRRCSHLSASTSHSDSQRFLLLQSRQKSRLHRTRTLSTTVSNEAIVMTEHKATESMREALKDTGPVKDLGYLLAGKQHKVTFVLFSVSFCCA